jgi:hypothetical protein
VKGNQPETNSASYQCAHCAEANNIFFDPSKGANQKYSEDCKACGRPSELSLFNDKWDRAFIIKSKRQE